MRAETITTDDAVDLERVLVALERIGSAGGNLAAVARRASDAILDVVAVTSPAEVEVEWYAEAEHKPH